MTKAKKLSRGHHIFCRNSMRHAQKETTSKGHCRSAAEASPTKDLYIMGGGLPQKGQSWFDTQGVHCRLNRRHIDKQVYSKSNLDGLFKLRQN
jgi:hypothetical protein